MALLNSFKSPFVRFNFMVGLTVLLLAVSLSQLYAVLNEKAPPSVDARLVLDAVQQLRQHDKALSCSADQMQGCDDALFIVYPAEYWGGQLSATPGTIVPLQDSQQQTMLCSVEKSGELLCLNQLNWPNPNEASVDLAYVFYFGILLALFLISRNLFRDMAILRQSALQEIRHGRFPDFELSSKSYLAPLAQSLHNMTDRIEQLNRFQAEMAETVCHDIKTPLARLKFISHLLNANSIEQSRGQIAQNLQEIEENVYDYLRLAENNYLNQELNLQHIELATFLSTLLAPHIDPTQVQLELVCESGLTCQADSKLLARGVNNLLINAMRFAKSKVLVSACLVPSAAAGEPAAFICISIEDDGPGWPKIDRPKLDSSSKAEHQPATDDGIAHHGLGLAIVRRVAEKHQGSLTLKESTAGGARAEIWFARSV